MTDVVIFVLGTNVGAISFRAVHSWRANSERARRARTLRKAEARIQDAQVVALQRMSDVAVSALLAEMHSGVVNWPTRQTRRSNEVVRVERAS